MQQRLSALLAAACLVCSASERGPVRDQGGVDDMVLVPTGEFTMGRTFATEDDETGMRPLVLRDDRPAHRVRLDAFWMDATEVTHAAYAKFVAAEGHRAPYHWPDGVMPEALANHPVYNVDWEDARAYCGWKGRRLPTEAEWERAARGGLEGKRYPWGNDKPDPTMARYSTQAGPGPAAEHVANEFGLHDMAGGVTEWCADWFERSYYSKSPAENPQGPEAGTYRIVRGGAWSDGPNRITVFFRNWLRPNQRTPNLGFRCARDAR